MHWKNSRFETAYIILGNCHTYDEAYRVLCELEEDREFSIESSLAESLRAQAKVVTSKMILADDTESKSGKLLAQCNIDEQKARTRIAQPCMDEARRELYFIRYLKSLIDPCRKFRRFPDHIAHQKIQPIEYMFDLHWKTYNHMASTGHVPHDHLMLLKMHPYSATLVRGMLVLRDLIQDDAEKFLMLTKQEVLKQVAEDNVSIESLFNTDLFLARHVLNESNFPPLSDLSIDAIQAAESGDPDEV